MSRSTPKSARKSSIFPTKRAGGKKKTISFESDDDDDDDDNMSVTSLSESEDEARRKPAVVVPNKPKAKAQSSQRKVVVGKPKQNVSTLDNDNNHWVRDMGVRNKYGGNIDNWSGSYQERVKKNSEVGKILEQSEKPPAHHNSVFNNNNSNPFDF
jgi:hypothetical protein